MPQSHNLNALTNTALKEIEAAQAAQAELLQKSSRRRPWLKMASAAVVAAMIIHLATDSHNKRYWLGVSEQQQVAEMTAALIAANLAVDRSHTTTGEWPDRVPLPALAALVELKNPGPDYRLLAHTQHALLTMMPSGDLHKTQR